MSDAAVNQGVPSTEGHYQKLGRQGRILSRGSEAAGPYDILAYLTFRTVIQ